MSRGRNAAARGGNAGASGGGQEDRTQSTVFSSSTATEHEWQSLGEAAASYARSGVPVFPLAPGTKIPLISKENGGNGFHDATTDPDQIESWWRENPTANIGMPTGAASKRIVIDVDERNGGDESLRDLEAEHGPLPETLTDITPGGEHRFFCHIDVSLPATLGAGIDVKSNGGYVVLPPSVHPSGDAYEWDASCTNMAELPLWIAELQSPQGRAIVPNVIPKGRRHDEVMRFACSMRQKGASEGVLVAALSALNLERCEPPLPQTEIDELAHDIATRYAPGEAIIYSRAHGLRAPHGQQQIERLNREPVLVTLADVQRENVSWRWADRLPLGKLTIIEGDPGVGKSHLTLAIATAVTLGEALPGDTGTFEPRNVLIMSAEDGMADTLRPRLEDMGADLSRVNILTAVLDADGQERFPSLIEDIAAMESALRRYDCGLVIIDPINAYLSGVDGHADVDVRSALGPLAQLAERHGPAVTGVRHITKSPRDKAIYRGAGSIAYTAAARSVLLVGQNPDAEAERIVVCIKHNLAADSPAMAFEIDQGRFLWRGESDVTASQLLAAEQDDDTRMGRAEAVAFLREALANGPRPAEDMMREADGAGISTATLRRAKHQLRIVVERQGEHGRRGGGSWWWALPGLGAQVLTREKVSTLTRKETDTQAETASGEHLKTSAASRFGSDAANSPSLNAFASSRPIATDRRCLACGARLSPAATRDYCGGLRPCTPNVSGSA